VKRNPGQALQFIPRISLTLNPGYGFEQNSGAKKTAPRERIVLTFQEVLLTFIGSRFALSEDRQSGIACCEDGIFVAGVPLLEKACARNAGWFPRPISDLNREISDQYGVPIDLSAKLDSLRAIARALDTGDLIYARLLTLHLRIPDPPQQKSVDELVVLAHRLRASGLLKVAWDPTKHPRWPAGAPGSVGGEFAPAGAFGDSGVAEETPRATTAQITIPVPWAIPNLAPLPSEITPAPLIPNIDPRHSLENPYPDRPECVEEWASAIKYCRDLIRQRLLGTDGHRGSGRTFQQCVLGRVSEACGGSSTA
jgi:hypothetical protein